MAASTASRPNPSAAQPAKRRGGWLFLLLAVPVALVLLPSTLVVLPAMIPTVVARIVDPTPGKHLTITVGSLNFAGSLWFLHELWSANQSFHAIVPTLGDMFGWLCALLGAGCGWVIYWTMPAVTRNIAATKSSLRLSRVRKHQEDLIEQWGEAVRGADAPAPNAEQ